MTGWIIDSLLATAALIALVLVLRRPVAQLAGAGAAYALWLLPAARAVMPPLTLPASMAPDMPANSADVVLKMPITQPSTMLEPAYIISSAWPFWLWLGGAAGLLIWQTAGYLMMRRTILRDARWLAPQDRIRIAESRSIVSPVAFGLLDPVVLMPDQLAGTERDQALAHELAHHRNGDIWANWLAQVLLALHWFNPLIWLAMRAFRQDQEAACDARVAARLDVEGRQTYARLIAGIASRRAGQGMSPLFSPIVGRSSIIHRIRSLAMPDISPRRRQFARISIAAALPLLLAGTATISYATDPQQEVRREIWVTQGNGANPPEIDTTAGPGEYVERFERDGKTFVFRTSHKLTPEEIERMTAEAEASLPDAPLPPAPPAPNADGSPTEQRREHHRIIMRTTHDEGGETVDIDRRVRHGPEDCAPGAGPTTEVRNEETDGRRVLIIKRCHNSDGDHAANAAKPDILAALREARAEIAADSAMSAEQRERALGALDREIARHSASR